MKKINQWWVIAFTVALCLAVLFCCLWIDARNNHQDLEYLCQASAAQCVSELRDFQSSGSEESYLKASGAFCSFMNAYGWLTEGKGKSANYTECSRVYGCLIFDREKSQTQIQLLLDGMKLLSVNIYDENGFYCLSEFSNAVEHGE